MARPWTKQEQHELLQGVGTYGIGWLARRVGMPYLWANAPKRRSVRAMDNKGRRLYGSGGLSRGSYSIRSMMTRTGYSSSQLRRAMLALAQKWKRTSPHGSFLVYDEQFEDLVQWLRTDYWSKPHRLYNCLWCHTDRREHKALGLCERCYYRYVKRLLRADLPTTLSTLLAWVHQEQSVSGKQHLDLVRQYLLRGRAVPRQALRELCDAS